MKFRIISFCILCLMPCIIGMTARAQNNNAKLKLSGFIKSDFWFDSRQVFSSREDLFLFYPRDIMTDAKGNDINAASSLNFSAITSRLTLEIHGTEAFGAVASGAIEGDFSGVTNDHINGLRLRHAWMKLRWPHFGMMAGQYWHPLFVPEVVPSVISLNTGAPFQPFIRNPLISFSAHGVKNSITFSVITQRDNASDGPDGFTSKYLRFSPLPNFHLQYLRKTETTSWGAGLDAKWIRPQMLTDSSILNHNKLPSYAAVAFFKYAAPSSFSVAAKTIFGSNLTEHLMLGGYALQEMDTLTGTASFTPTKHLFAWAHFSYGNKWKPAFFAGYLKNFGTVSENTGRYYARGENIASMWRLSPSISWISGKTQLSAEAELTAAAFGKPDNDGVPVNTHEVKNLRLLFTFFYFF
jgi:hypothetical protein